MAKGSSGLFNSISGTLGKQITFRTLRKIILQKKPAPMDRKTQKQLQRREIYKKLCELWSILEKENKQEYEQLAKQYNLTSFNAFLKKMLNSIRANETFEQLPNRGEWDIYYYIRRTPSCHNGYLILKPNDYINTTKTIVGKAPAIIQITNVKNIYNSVPWHSIYLATEYWHNYIGIGVRPYGQNNVKKLFFDYWINYTGGIEFFDVFDDTQTLTALITPTKTIFKVNNNIIYQVQLNLQNITFTQIDFSAENLYNAQQPNYVDGIFAIVS